MKISGSHEFDAPPAAIYDRLLDPDRLRGCMPGCEKLEKVSESQLEVVLAPPVPTLKGTFEGTVQIRDADPPHSFTMRIEATGKSGFVNADAKIAIESVAGGSKVIYDAEAEVGGLAASAGQRVLAGITRRQVEQMMRCLESGRPGLLARFLIWLDATFKRKKK